MPKIKTMQACNSPNKTKLRYSSDRKTETLVPRGTILKNGLQNPTLFQER